MGFGPSTQARNPTSHRKDRTFKMISYNCGRIPCHIKSRVNESLKYNYSSIYVLLAVSKLAERVIFD